MEEQWRALPGYEGLYEVSDQTRVRTVGRTTDINGRMHTVAQRVLKGSQGPYGHRVVGLTRDGSQKLCRVIDLVLAAFVGPAPAGEQAVHKDGDQLNEALSNLEYGPSRDREHFFNPGNRRLVPKQIREIRASTLSSAALGEQYKMTEQNIRMIRTRRTWKEVE